jgi:hypothetical protein
MMNLAITFVKEGKVKLYIRLRESIEHARNLELSAGRR